MDEENAEIKRQVLQTTLQETRISSAIESEAADPCVICLESISEPAIAVPCHHRSFDFLCLVSWLQERPTCPLCKEKITIVEYNIDHEGCREVYKVPSTSEQRPSSSRDGRLSQDRRRDGMRVNEHLYRSQRRHRSNRARSPISPDAALSRRKYVYENMSYSLHVGSNRLSRFSDLKPEDFVRDAQLVSRARKWIRRELQVFDFLGARGGSTADPSNRGNNAEFLLEYIVAILKTVDTKSSGGQAEEMLREFLGRDSARLFLHELRAWLRSPYTELHDWDRWVQYSNQSTKPGASNSRCGRQTSLSEGKLFNQSQGPDRRRPNTGEGHHRIRRYVDYYEPYKSRPHSRG